MCQKWINVGAFYPFARTHDDIGDKGQEPYQFNTTIQTTMRNAIRWRYALIRYYYTQLYMNNAHGGMFWKPLFFEFPDEQHAYDNIERNIMIGPAIKMSSILEPGQIQTQPFIFPPGVWCNIIDYTCIKTTTTSDQTLKTTADQLNLHLRMGYIIPLQRNAVTTRVNNTVELNKLTTGLMINININNNLAEGQFYADDGEALQPSTFSFVTLSMSYDSKTVTGTLSVIHSGANYKSDYTQVDLIEIVGVSFSIGLSKMTKIKIGEADPITGNFDSSRNLLSYKLPTPIEITEVKEIKFSS